MWFNCSNCWKVDQLQIDSRLIVRHQCLFALRSVFYKQSSLDSEASEFLDPNKLSPDGLISISTTAFSEDGRYFAYGLSEGGSDWITIHVCRFVNIHYADNLTMFNTYRNGFVADLYCL